MDDQESIKNIMEQVLIYLGYEVECVGNRREVIDRYRRAMSAEAAFDVVSLDLTIPGGMGAKEIIRELRKLNPDLKAIASSGYADGPVMSQYQSYGFMAAVAKPYEVSEPSRTLWRVIT